jgi:hypothetical protein
VGPVFGVTAGVGEGEVDFGESDFEAGGVGGARGLLRLPEDRLRPFTVVESDRPLNTRDRPLGSSDCASTNRSWSGRLDSAYCRDSVDAAVERRDRFHAARLCARDEIGLREVDPVDLIDLKCA